jgi:riboflavin synthase
MGETIKRSNLSRLKYGDPVNLEGSLRMGETLGGHFVSGHIDCVGRIKDVRHSAGDRSIEITFPQMYRNLVVEKGSIALDGVSLTIGKVMTNGATVYIIPHTLKMTTLMFKRRGDDVNIEFDIIGKYIVNKFENKRFS